MKDKKKLLLLLPILVFVLTFIGMYFINKSYAINSDTAVVNQAIKNGTKYSMIRKNTYSWHLITHNFRSFSSTNASGTKLLRTNSKINGSYSYAVVYCATEGEVLASSANRKRYSIDSSKVSMSNAKKTKLKSVMPYMYPYTTLGNLKTTLKSSIGIGSSYSKYSFDKLTAQEAITASQAAIWNIRDGYSGAHYSYRGTISSFSAFDTCKEYYKNKVITSEEQAWYNASGCSSSGNFYKFVFKHKKDSNTKNRINTLIKWYVKKAFPSSNNETFSIGNKSLNENNLTVTLNTNMSSYSVIFKDQRGTTLLSTNKTSNNTYTIPNLSTSVTQVKVEVTSKNAQNHIYYYKSSSGQDFIGLEKTYYTNSATFNIVRPTVEVQTGKIIIYKVGDTSKNVEVTTNLTGSFDASKCEQSNPEDSVHQCLNNAKFELYYEGKDEENLVHEIILDYSDSSTYVIGDLALGTYYLKETQPAYGYNLYENGTAPVDSDGFIKIEITGNQTFDVLVNNNKNKICFAKVDATTGEHLAKGRFLIYDIDGTILEDYNSSANVGQETYCLEGQLQSGSYFIQEIEAPEGYAVDPTLYHFTVGNSENDISALEDIGEYREATAVNGVITFKNSKLVSVSKSDATTGACVEGAKLIVRDSNGEIVKDSFGNVIGEWISKCESETEELEDITGECVKGYDSYPGEDSELGSDLDGDDSEEEYVCTDTSELDRAKDSYRLSLEPGNYTLTEVMTEELKAQGYSSKPDTISFTVNADGSVTGSTEMKDEPIKYCISKLNSDRSKHLAGAKFEIYKEDKETKVVSFTSGDRETCIERLPIGNYILKEIEAPAGYKVSKEEISFTVEDTDQKQMLEIINEIEAPKTDLDRTKTIMIISIIFMVFGIGMVGYYGFKKKN